MPERPIPSPNSALPLNPDLPIAAQALDIAEAIRTHQVCVVAGATGSGKTTQLPRLCLGMGFDTGRVIGLTQPRRIAARSVARRIATELGVEAGRSGPVGSKVRFDDQTSRATRIKVMTDGVLLAEYQEDRAFERYGVLLVDEAHERSLTIDLLLGLIKRTLPRRPDLRIIIASATIDPERFSAYFGGPSAAPVIRVRGRTFPVDIRYRPVTDDDNLEEMESRAVAEAALELLPAASSDGARDVLVLLPGEREIRAAAEELRRAGAAEILPLYSRLSNSEQDRVFNASGAPRIILATNVAETSLTVPGVRHVVDTGLARVRRYDPGRRIQRLEVEMISRASADQRAGRCGRVAPGVCVRLYSRAALEAMSAFTTPEIRRSGLAPVILNMQSMDLGRIEDFEFLETPEPSAVREGLETLVELGALEHASSDAALTSIGRQLAKLPLDPRIGRMVIAAQDEGCVDAVVPLAAVLAIQDPRDRPSAARDQADAAHQQFAHPRSDFLSLLGLWRAFGDVLAGRSGMSVAAWCRAQFVSLNRMREWSDMARQVEEVCRAMGLTASERSNDEGAIHRSLLTGLLSNVCCRDEASREHLYHGARGNRVSIFPGSVLFKSSPRWIMAAEFVQTTRLYARMLAAIEPEWIETIGSRAVVRTPSDPHYDAETGTPSAFVRITLGGVTIAPRRRCNLADINQDGARAMYMRKALVEGATTVSHEVLEANKKLLARAELARERLRRPARGASDILTSLFDTMLPAGVTSDATLRAAILAGWSPETVRLREDQVVDELIRPGLDEAVFPSRLPIGGGFGEFSYRHAPPQDEDGVTLRVALLLLPHVDDRRLEWLVPGYLTELIAALIRALPKKARSALEKHGPVEHLARDLAGVLVFGEGSLAAGLTEAAAVLWSEHVEQSAWMLRHVPEHLRLRLLVHDDQGKELAASRDVGALREQLAGRLRRAQAGAARRAFERTGLTTWDFDALPSAVEVGDGNLAYPCIVDEGESVSLTLTGDAAAGARLTSRGVRRLLILQAKDELLHRLESAAGWIDAVRFHKALGSSDMLADHIMGLIVDRVFLHGQSAITDRETFESRQMALWGKLGSACFEIVEQAGRMLEDRAAVAARLSGGTPRNWAASTADLREHAAYLMPPGFLGELTWERFREYPRYVAGMRARLAILRESGSPAETQGLAQLLPHWKRFTAWAAAAMAREHAQSDERASIKGGGKPSLPGQRGKRGSVTINADAGQWAMQFGGLPAPIEHYRWMLEEYRLQLLAPQVHHLRVGTIDLDKAWSAAAIHGDGPNRVT